MFSLILAVFSVRVVSAQDFSIKGRLVNGHEYPIQFVGINLFSEDGLLRKQAITDSLGFFSLNAESGQYFIRGKQFDKMLFEKPVNLTTDVNLGTIYVKESIVLEGVTVNAPSQLLERKVDRLVFNVQNSIGAAGGSGLDALTITPLVKVDEDGSVSIVGKGSVGVMINDKIINLSGTDLTNYLRSLRSDDIAKIEVVTVPSSKYEAQGNSGLINIVLKKRHRSGWDGYLTSRARQNTYTGISESFGLNYSSDRLTTSLKMNYFDDKSRAEENYDILGSYSSKSSSKRKDKYKGFGINAGLDYQLSQNSTLGFIYVLGYDRNDKDIDEGSQYFTSDILTNSMFTSTERKEKTPTHTLNSYYEYKLGANGNKLSFSGNFFQRNPSNAVNFSTIDDVANSAYNVYNTSEVKYRIWSVQGDLVLDTKLAKFETGVKYADFNNRSDIGYYNIKEDGQPIIVPDRSNRFNYLEENYAGYVSGEKDLGKKWSLQVGLRYEYSVIKGISESEGDVNSSKYGNIFPNAYISYKANDDNSLTISYSKRINRPGFSELNPFRWYSNPNTYSSGNPELRPSFNHNFELSYLFKGKFSVSTYFQRTLDGYDQLTKLDSIYEISSYKNCYNQNSIGLNLTFADKVFKWWESNDAFNVSHSTSEVFYSDMIAQSGWGANFSTSNTIGIDKDKTKFLVVNYWQNLPSRIGNALSKGRASFQLGTKLYFLDKKLISSLTVNDVFRQLKGRGINYYQDNTQYFNNYYDSRNISVNVMYKFGMKPSKKHLKEIEFKEKDRQFYSAFFQSTSPFLYRRVQQNDSCSNVKCRANGLFLECLDLILRLQH